MSDEFNSYFSSRLSARSLDLMVFPISYNILIIDINNYQYK